jgi:hypothetical protein
MQWCADLTSYHSCREQLPVPVDAHGPDEAAASKKS